MKLCPKYKKHGGVEHFFHRNFQFRKISHSLGNVHFRNVSDKLLFTSLAICHLLQIPRMRRPIYMSNGRRVCDNKTNDRWQIKLNTFWTHLSKQLWTLGLIQWMEQSWKLSTNETKINGKLTKRMATIEVKSLVARNNSISLFH